jgi:hydroxypyruvate isomerase
MPKLAANLHYLFTEVEFLDRFEAAARAGFTGVEFQVPYDYSIEALSERLREFQLTLVLIDTPMGDWSRGERGLACVPGREAEFRHGVARACEYADALRCEQVHVMAGVPPVAAAEQEIAELYVANLRFAAAELARAGTRAVIEPINRKFGQVQDAPSYTTQGMRGYFLNFTAQARDFLSRANCDNLYLHLDFYHMQILEGHLAETVRDNIDVVRHFQIAGVPGRNEPDTGEINYPFLFDLIDSLGYAGWIGCEYRPRAGTLAGLGWARRYGIGAANR